jgi:hypothetical protein
MGLLGNILGRLRPGKRSGKQLRSRVPGVVGHRGIAAGDLRPGRQDLSPENVGRWQNLSGDEVSRFVNDNELLLVHSTNVHSAAYDPELEELTVWFLTGKGTVYGDVSTREALDFAQAQSKGGWVIDVCIGRENLQDHAHWFKHGGKHRKPARPL